MANLPSASSPKLWGTTYNTYLRVEHKADGTHDEITADSLIMKSPWVDVKAYGATGDGTTDDTAAIQAAIDAVGAVKGILIFPVGTYSFDDTLEIYNSITIEGLGRQAGKWNDNEAGVILRWDGDAATDAIIIGGTSDSDLVDTAFNCTEGVTLKNFLLIPGTELDAAPAHSEGGKDGIVIDGSSTLDANRGFARDIVLENVDVRRFLGYGVQTLGTAFNIRLVRCGIEHNVTAGYKNSAAASNLGSGTAGQNYLYDTMLWSYGAGAPAGDMIWTTMFGGHVQGEEGVILNAGCNIYGTHIEGDNARPADGTIGIYIKQRGGNIFPELAVTHYNYGIKIGDGSASSHDTFYGNVGIVQNCTVGVWITDGGSRRGFLHVSLWGAGGNVNTADVQDDRLDNDTVNRYGLEFLQIGSNGILVDNTVVISKLITLANDGTPTVALGNLFQTGGTTTITDFDDGITGQIITVLCKHSLTFDFTTGQDADHNLDGSSADITADTGDILTFLCEDGTTWNLKSNLDASVDNN